MEGGYVVQWRIVIVIIRWGGVGGGSEEQHHLPPPARRGSTCLQDVPPQLSFTLALLDVMLYCAVDVAFTELAVCN